MFGQNTKNNYSVPIDTSRIHIMQDDIKGVKPSEQSLQQEEVSFVQESEKQVQKEPQENSSPLAQDSPFGTNANLSKTENISQENSSSNASKGIFISGKEDVPQGIGEKIFGDRDYQKSNPTQNTFSDADARLEDAINTNFAQQQAASGQVLTQNASSGGKGWIIFVAMLIFLGGGVYYWIAFMDGAEQVEKLMARYGLFGEEDEARELDNISFVQEDEAVKEENVPIMTLYTHIPNPVIAPDQATFEDELTKASDFIASEQKEGLFTFQFFQGATKTEKIDAQTLLTYLNPTLAEKIGGLIVGDVQVYMLYESGAVKIAFTFETLDRETLEGTVQKNEELLFDYNSLFAMGNDRYQKVGVFSDSSHRTYEIRYVNFDSKGLYSIDYAFRRNTLIIASSKKTIRAVLDEFDGVEDPSENKL